MFNLFTKGGTRRKKQSKKNRKSRRQKRYRGGVGGERNADGQTVVQSRR
jgi:hypothetical protein